jgi:hypothetical protein
MTRVVRPADSIAFWCMGFTRLALAILGSVALAAAAERVSADELEPVSDPVLREMLNGLVVLAERHDGVSVRVIGLKHFGTCDEPDPLSCPKQDVFVAISQAEAFPEQRLFRLPLGFGWHFVEWKNVPQNFEDPKGFAVFQMKEDVMEKAAAPSSGKSEYVWHSKLYEVGVNLRTSYMRPVE